MNVMNCKSCGRIFNVLANETICPNCRQKADEKFQTVKEFLENNPNSNVDDVSRETGVSTKQIRQWIREERLTFAEGSIEGIECEQCGAMILTGRFCEKCKANLSNTFKNALDKPKQVEKKRERDGNRMRFLQS